MPGFFCLVLESTASLAIKTASMICLPFMNAICCESTSLSITPFSLSVVLVQASSMKCNPAEATNLRGQFDFHKIPSSFVQLLQSFTGYGMLQQQQQQQPSEIPLGGVWGGLKEFQDKEGYLKTRITYDIVGFTDVDWGGSQAVTCEAATKCILGTSTTRTWGVTSLFGIRGSSVGHSSKRHATEVVHDINLAPPVIQLKNPPPVLRPGETETEYQVEIIVTKLLITSYYDIVRRNIQDLVPKAIMHYLVNHAKRNLLGTFIEKLYRENLYEDLLREHDDVVIQRRTTLEMCNALRQAVETLDEFVVDVSTLSSSDSMDALPNFSYLSSNSYSKSST
ncbi:hypothetical protein MTR67_033694 [Solanum verrucosum]|uniref:GED domain-containing protein n=1 Tax=Solanum verrucosum TaxID=315347 RepID=A0AAF0ZKK9_SOLVR|nr:hypothetical protein MTR67_033694 [Solanum verrucosum]